MLSEVPTMSLAESMDREAQLQKIPYMLTIGDKEMEQGKISVRLRSGEVLNFIDLDEFVEKVTGEYKAKQTTSPYEKIENKETSH